MRRFIAGVLFLAGAFWTLPALYTFMAMGSAGVANEAAAGLTVMTALIYVFPGLVLIGLGTLIWPKRPDKP